MLILAKAYATLRTPIRQLKNLPIQGAWLKTGLRGGALTSLDLLKLPCAGGLKLAQGFLKSLRHFELRYRV